jgi:hypothetical protein
LAEVCPCHGCNNSFVSFQEKAKETREKVKLLLQLADTLVDKGHAHAPSIKKWVEDVDATYKDFSTRMEHYRGRLETTLGIHNNSQQLCELSLDRESESGISLGSYSRSQCYKTFTAVILQIFI